MQLFEGTVLVAGATGRTGQWVVRCLQNHRIDMNLFVRSQEKATGIFGPEITGRLTIGSLEHPEEIDAALKRCGAVISALGSHIGDPKEAPPSAVDRDGVIRLASQARRMGIRTFILVSSLAVTREDHPLNRYGRVLSMKLESENAVRKLFGEPGCSYTILRPGGLLDGPPLLHALLFDTGDTLSGVIDRSDVAETCVLSLWHPAARNMTFELVRSGEARQNSLAPYFDRLAAHLPDRTP